MEMEASTSFGNRRVAQRVHLFEDSPEVKGLSRSEWASFLFCPCINFLSRHSLTSSATLTELNTAIVSFMSLVALAQFIMLVIALVKAGHNYFMLEVQDCLALINLGAQNANMIKSCAQLWRMFTSMFLHAGLIHWFLNMWIHFRVGLFLERQWRWIRLSIIFFLSGIAGNLLACVLQPFSTGASASAALIGVMGAYTVEVVFTWYKTQSHARAISLFWCVFYIISTFILGSINQFVENSASFGGVIVGVLLGIYYSVQESQFDYTVKEFLPKVIVVIITIFFVANFVIFFSLIDTTILTSPLSSGPLANSVHLKTTSCGVCPSPQ